MERDQRRDDRRRDDNRDRKPRYDRERSRSPQARERRGDDRRRDRSPPRGPPNRADRDESYHRGRGGPRSGGRPSRQQQDSRSNYGSQRDRPDSQVPPSAPDDYMQDGNSEIEMQRAPGVNGLRSTHNTRVPGNGMNYGAEMKDENVEAAMQRFMGFTDFRTTKNTKVPGNDKNYGVYKAKKTEYRQYMNRLGGFNRPLSPTRT